MTAPFWYRGYGVTFRSDLELPEFAPCGPGAEDVAIRLGKVPPDTPVNVFGKAGDGHGMAVPGVGAFQVRGGREIIVAPAPDHEPGLLRLYLIGSAMGMLFHQRGQLVIHGAGVVHGDQACLFVGASGAGKSTLSAHLGAAGLAILADDTVPLVADGPRFTAWPGSRVFKLWRDALAGLAGDVAGHQPVGNRFDKFYAPNPAVAPDRAVPITGLIELVERAGDPMLERMTGLEAMQVITEHTYRPEYVPLLGRETAHFRLVSAMTGAVAVHRLHRPRDMDRMGDVIALLQAHWAADA